MSLQIPNLVLQHFNFSLKIDQKSLPPEHPHIAMTLENRGLVYEDNDELERALEFYIKVATIFRHSLTPTHHRVVEIERDVQRILGNVSIRHVFFSCFCKKLTLRKPITGVS